MFKSLKKRSEVHSLVYYQKFALGKYHAIISGKTSLLIQLDSATLRFTKMDGGAINSN